MSTATDQILFSRATLSTLLIQVADLERSATNARLQHAGGDLDGATKWLADCDRVVDAIGVLVERARISVAREWELRQPTQSEEVAA